MKRDRLSFAYEELPEEEDERERERERDLDLDRERDDEECRFLERLLDDEFDRDRDLERGGERERVRMLRRRPRSSERFALLLFFKSDLHDGPSAGCGGDRSRSGIAKMKRTEKSFSLWPPVCMHLDGLHGDDALRGGRESRTGACGLMALKFEKRADIR